MFLYPSTSPPLIDRFITASASSLVAGYESPDKATPNGSVALGSITTFAGLSAGLSADFSSGLLGAAEATLLESLISEAAGGSTAAPRAKGISTLLPTTTSISLTSL